MNKNDYRNTFYDNHLHSRSLTSLAISGNMRQFSEKYVRDDDHENDDLVRYVYILEHMKLPLPRCPEHLCVCQRWADLWNKRFPLLHQIPSADVSERLRTTLLVTM